MDINRNKIMKAVNEAMNRVVKENYDMDDDDLNEAQMAVDFYDFVDALERNGFSYIAYMDIKTKDGDDATRFVLDGDGDIDILKQELDSMAKFDNGIVFGTATSRNAPEIKHPTVIIKYGDFNNEKPEDASFDPDDYNTGDLDEGLFGDKRVEGGGGMYKQSDIKGFEKDKKEFERIFGTKHFFLNGPTSKEGVSLYIKSLKGDYALIKFDRNGEAKVYNCQRIGEPCKFVRNMTAGELNRNNPVSYAHDIWEKYGRSSDMGGLSDEQLMEMVKKSVIKALTNRK